MRLTFDERIETFDVGRSDRDLRCELGKKSSPLEEGQTYEDE